MMKMGGIEGISEHEMTREQNPTLDPVVSKLRTKEVFLIFIHNMYRVRQQCYNRKIYILIHNLQKYRRII